ncbi:hypothetical protein ACFX2C_005194 [Malus domestica]
MKGVGFSDMDDNLIFEVFKHVDAPTLGMASCVSRQWHKMTEDERLWKLICTGHYWLRQPTAEIYGPRFRQVHAHYIWRLSKASSFSSFVPSFSSAASSSASHWAMTPEKSMLNLKPRERTM